MNTPQLSPQTPNYTNYQPDLEVVKLRRRVGDLLKLGAATPETYVQTVMQLFQEAERRRQICMSEAEDHLRKHQALVAQAHGFSTISGILFNIVNGFAVLEEKRVEETVRTDAERTEKEEAAKAAAPNGNGHSSQEGEGEPAAIPAPAPSTPSGGKRRKKQP